MKSPQFKYCDKCLRRLEKRSPRKANTIAEVLNQALENLGCEPLPAKCMGVCAKNRITVRLPSGEVREWKPSKGADKALKRLRRLLPWKEMTV